MPITDLIPMFGNKTKSNSKRSKSEQKAVDVVKDLATESARSRSNRIISDGKSIEKWWDLSASRWMGDHHENEPRAGIHKFTLNRDQVSITSNVADQTAQPFRPRFAAVENNDEPVLFISSSASQKLMSIFAQEMEAAFEADRVLLERPPAILFGMIDLPVLAGHQPLTQDEAAFVRTMTKPFTDPRTGEMSKPILDHRAIITVNDAYRAEVLQKVFDLKWIQANGDRVASENEWLSNLYGTAWMWAELDPIDWSFSLKNIEVKNVLPDPINFQTDDLDYIIVMEVLDFNKAVLMFPEHKSELERARTEGRIKGGSGKDQEWTLAANTTTTDFLRPMVIVQTAYIRNQSYPMDVEDALERELVFPAKDEQQLEDGTFVMMDVLDDEGNTTYQLEDGSLTSEDNDNWPKVKGIRCIKILADIDALIFDRRSPYSQVPIGHNRNLPIPFSPYGLPESQRTYHVQNTLNMAGQAIINNMLYFQFPQQYWPQSLLEDLDEQQHHSHPGRVIGIPDAKWLQMSQTGMFQHAFTVMPPAISSGHIQVYLDAKAEHELMTQHSGVRQGVPPSADISGKAVQELVQQALGPLGFKSSYTEAMIEYISKLLADSLISYMPEPEWRRICSELTTPAFDAMFDGLDTLGYDVMCEIVSGRGANKILDQKRAVEDLQVGAISMQTYMQRREIPDPSGERRRIAEERQDMAELQEQPQPTGTQ